LIIDLPPNVPGIPVKPDLPHEFSECFGYYLWWCMVFCNQKL